MSGAWKTLPVAVSPTFRKNTVGCECADLRRAEQEAVVKHQQQEEKQRQRALSYADSIRGQMQQRQSSAAARRRLTVQEGRQRGLKEQQRRLRLTELTQKKLQELR